LVENANSFEKYHRALLAENIEIFLEFKSTDCSYRVAKMHRMHRVAGLFSQKSH